MPQRAEVIFDVYSVVYNEAELIQEFLRHYGFARRIILYDNESTDDTVAIARSCQRVDVRTFSTGGKYDELAQMEIRNNAWRESADADYVVVCDADEFVDCKPVEQFGRHEVAFCCRGRNMIGVDGQPIAQICRYVTSGAFEDRYDKVSVFSPRIAGINYDPGMHTAHPTCPVVPEPRPTLRHYCYLGEEWLVRRYNRCRNRMSDSNLRHGFGYQYIVAEAEVRRVYRKLLANAIEEQ